MTRPSTTAARSLGWLVFTGLTACAAGNGPVGVDDPPTDAAIRSCEAIPIVPASGQDDAMAWKARVPLIDEDGDDVRRGWTADGRILSEVSDEERIRTTYLPGSWRIAQQVHDRFDTSATTTEVETWDWSGDVATITRDDGSLVYQAHRADGLPARRWRYELDGSETTMQRWTYVDDTSWQLAGRSAEQETWEWSCVEGEGLDGLDRLVAEISDEDGTRFEHYDQGGRLLQIEWPSGEVELVAYHRGDSGLPSWGVSERSRDAEWVRYGAVSTWVSADQDLPEPVLTEPDPVSTSCEPIPSDAGPYTSDAPAWQSQRGADPIELSGPVVWTADGRRLESHPGSPPPPDSGPTYTTYLPNDWRLASRQSFGFTGSLSTWIWDGSFGLEDRNGGDVREHEHRDDGLLLRTSVQTPDGPIVLQEYTYLGPDTWQIAEANGQPRSWDCLTMTEPYRASHHPDGRIGWVMYDHDSIQHYAYIDDSWRTESTTISNGNGYSVTRTWKWTPL